MILLDTNVVSVIATPDLHPKVRDWFDRQAFETLFLSSITVGEMLFGLGVMPSGKRKDRLTAVMSDVLDVFEPRILPFDAKAARRYAALAVKARAAGLGFPAPDSYIAAIAATHGFTVATRDASAFVAAGVNVINPWG